MGPNVITLAGLQQGPCTFFAKRHFNSHSQRNKCKVWIASPLFTSSVFATKRACLSDLWKNKQWQKQLWVFTVFLDFRTVAKSLYSSIVPISQDCYGAEGDNSCLLSRSSSMWWVHIYYLYQHWSHYFFSKWKIIIDSAIPVETHLLELLLFDTSFHLKLFLQNGPWGVFCGNISRQACETCCTLYSFLVLSFILAWFLPFLIFNVIPL